MPASVAWPEAAAESTLARDARAGLARAGQKTLPCKYLYDDVGSLLFEAICALPEYGLTAADERLLRAHAGDMLAPCGPGLAVAELGSGSARKSRWLLEALLERQARADYFPIEISPTALDRCRAHFAGLARLDLHPLEMEYLDGLAAIPRRGPLLVLFLGSSLGNFAPAEAGVFLAAVRRHLRPGDGLLLGLDLVKPRPLLLAAYDDPAGVTAAFNLNLLARLNRELGANFDLRQWRHNVVYRTREQRVEMHLRSRRDQTATWPGGPRLAFHRGETIWTESSHKYRPADLAGLFAAVGFRLARRWTDPAWLFSECLLLPAGPA